MKAVAKRLLILCCGVVLMACGGDETSDPAAPLVETRVADEEACESGGTEIVTGIDEDGDGILSEAEIRDIVVVCNGEAGAQGGAGERGEAGVCAGTTPVEISATLEQAERYRASLSYRLEVTTEAEGAELVVVGAEIAGEVEATESGLALDIVFPVEGYRDVLVVATDGCTMGVDQVVADVLSAPYEYLGSGWIHTCGLRVDGSITCWGSNTLGGTGADPMYMGAIDAPAGHDFVALDVGALGACATRANNSVECWGSLFDVLSGGFGMMPGPTVNPQEALTGVSVGVAMNCGVTVDGALHCWANRAAETWTMEDLFEDASDKELARAEVAISFSGYLMVLLLMENGETYVVAVAVDSEGEEEMILTPEEAVPTMEGEDYQAIDLGLAFACGLQEDTSATCYSVMDWVNEIGEEEPVWQAEQGVEQLSVGSTFVCTRKEDQSVLCESFEEGIDFGEFGESPLDVPEGVEFVDISAGFSHVCGITTEQMVQCWGEASAVFGGPYPEATIPIQ